MPRATLNFERLSHALHLAASYIVRCASDAERGIVCHLPATAPQLLAHLALAAFLAICLSERRSQGQQNTAGLDSLHDALRWSVETECDRIDLASPGPSA